LKVISAAMGNTLQKANPNAIGESDDDNRAEDPQQDVVGPLNVIAESEVALNQQQDNDGSKWKNRL
jgi:hypothetical protein